MITTIRYILLTALRDWLFIGLFVALFLAFGVSFFLGDTALVEEQQMRLVNVSGSTRLILLVGLVVFVCFHVRRAFDNREIEVILSRPISRVSFVVSYWLGFSVIAFLLIAPLTLVIGLTLRPDISGLLYWSTSLLAESLIMLAFSLFASLILRSAVTSVLLCFGFYTLTRMMGFFLYILERPGGFDGSIFGTISHSMLWFTSSVIPRLDLFAKSDWLIYGIAQDTYFWLYLAQSAIAVPFFLVFAIIDFNRRQF